MCIHTLMWQVRSSPTSGFISLRDAIDLQTGQVKPQKGDATPATAGNGNHTPSTSAPHGLTPGVPLPEDDAIVVKGAVVGGTRHQDDDLASLSRNAENMQRIMEQVNDSYL